MRRASLQIAVLMVTSLALTNSALGLNTYWRKDIGWWHGDDNWTNGAPESGDSAYISNGGTATVYGSEGFYTLYLGYLNPGIVPIGLFLGFLLGAVAGIAAMAIGKGGRKTALPFGPFLAAGTVIAVFAGQEFVDQIWHR